VNKILITDGAGFIGSNLTDYLLNEEKSIVTAIDNFDLFYAKNIKENNIRSAIQHKNYSFVEEDILNINNNRSLNEAPNDTVIHIAAKAGVRPSMTDTASYHLVNVEGTKRLLDWCVEKEIKKMILASSSSVYGINKNFPWKETDELSPISPYAETKLLC
jgi:UDP-glucuronate 4-epimerase